MLKEIFLTQVRTNEGYKRWFQDDYFDLFVWQDFYNGEIISFQLCYDRAGRERVISWHHQRGFEHYRVDDGEQTPYKNMTPVFINESIFPYHEVLQNFIDNSDHIGQSIKVFIERKLLKLYEKSSKE